MKFKPHNYQVHAEKHIVNNSEAGLFLGMGLGKTIITFNALDRLMFDNYEIFKVLIIAPKKVAETVWIDEKNKWDHLKHFKISLVLGTEAERKAALKARAHVYVVSRDNVKWLVNFYKMKFSFDMIVIDELSSFKSQKAQRFKALRMVRPLVKRVIGLTGTPAPNSLLDLWAQINLLDQGKRLGLTFTQFRDKYFVPAERIGGFAVGYRLRKPDKSERKILGEDYFSKQIYGKIADICISMKAEDYLELPPVIYNDIIVKLKPETLQRYKDFEREQVLMLNEDADEITAFNAAALSTKLRQFVSGAIYDEDKKVHPIHEEKLEALAEIIDTANGNPVLVFYWFKHDLERLLVYLKRFKPQVFNKRKTKETVDAWNAGKINLLLAQPGSTGHGLNMQAGGHIVTWFSLTWSLELFQQANARIARQGNEAERIIINRLVAKGTIDERMLASNYDKDNSQKALLKAVKAIIKTYKHEKRIK